MLFRSTARTVRGGRHVVAMALDDPDAFEELDENNNLYGEQWIWSPRNLTLGTPLTRAAPPDRIGGWDQITSGESHWFNCDGLRTPFFLPAGQDGYWAAVAVMPGDTSDADVRFHENSGGAKSGLDRKSVV